MQHSGDTLGAGVLRFVSECRRDVACVWTWATDRVCLRPSPPASCRAADYPALPSEAERRTLRTRASASDPSKASARRRGCRRKGPSRRATLEAVSWSAPNRTFIRVVMRRPCPGFRVAPTFTTSCPVRLDAFRACGDFSPCALGRRGRPPGPARCGSRATRSPSTHKPQTKQQTPGYATERLSLRPSIGLSNDS